MRLESIFILLAAIVGLLWFQRLCEEILWVRKHDLHGLYLEDFKNYIGGHPFHLPSSSNTTESIPFDPRFTHGPVFPVTDGSATTCKRLLWFMGLHAEDASQFEYYTYLKVALLSAKRNAPSLIPHLVFDGAPNEVTAWVERHGGRVIFHDLTLEEAMKRAVELGHQPPEWFRNRGAFLRMDIPFIFPRLLAEHAGEYDIEREFFLYTDNDVLFLNDINSCSFQQPRFFTIGAEHAKGRAENTGVMYVNATAFAEERDGIVQHAIAHDWKFGAMDQGLIIDYMFVHNMSIPVLPDKYNWKGYWGGDENVSIVHFHGPKPERCLPCLLENTQSFWEKCHIEQSCPDAYKGLFSQANDRGMFFKKMLQMYNVLKWEAANT